MGGNSRMEMKIAAIAAHSPPERSGGLDWWKRRKRKIGREISDPVERVGQDIIRSSLEKVDGWFRHNMSSGDTLQRFLKDSIG